MSILARPFVAALAARTMQQLAALAQRNAQRNAGRGGRGGSRLAPRDRFPQYRAVEQKLVIPTSLGPADAFVYAPVAANGGDPVPVHVDADC